jgi:hypothetical protein
METSVIIAIITSFSTVVLGLLQFKNYKAQANKTNIEAQTLEESLEQAREKQFFDQVMAFSAVSSQKVLETNDEVIRLEKALRECKDLKEQLCEERITLIRKVREYEPDFQSNNPAA